jgi:Ca2+-binding RTX toxin-like protein
MKFSINGRFSTAFLILLAVLFGVPQALALPAAGFGSEVDEFCAENGYALQPEFGTAVGGNCLACHGGFGGESGPGETAYKRGEYEFFCPAPAPVNTPPVAHAGPDQTGTAGSVVTLNGSGSSDADGDSLSFAWALTTIPAGSGARLSDSTAVMPTFVSDVAGQYVAELLVSDGTDNSFPDMVNINLDRGNTAPVADAGANQSVIVTDLVSLDGGGSSDVDGDGLIYAWSFMSRPPNSAATLSNANAVNPTFRADLAGDYLLQLIVNDGSLDSDPATVNVNAGHGNTAPVADAGSNQAPLVGDIVQLDGGGSSDVDGDSLTYRWSFTARPAGSATQLSSASAVMPTFEVDVAGNYLVQLIVNDGSVDSDSASVSINAGSGNTAPVADAGTDQAVLVGDSVQLDGSGSSDANGDALAYIWSFTSVPTGSAAALSDTGSVMPAFRVDLAGSYVVQLVVNDGATDSLPATVTINAEDPTNANTAPLADAGPDQQVVLASTVIITLDGSGSVDPDGQSLSYLWSFLTLPAGSTATLSGAGGMSPVFGADVAGEYVVQLIVNDGMAGSAPDTVIVVADPQIVPPPEGGCDLSNYPGANVIYGTDGDDHLNGTSGVDVIFGMGGNDRINAGAGDDCIDGGPGNDRINGGTGQDMIYGGAENDKLVGGKGNDTLHGGDDSDALIGGRGNDACFDGELVKGCEGEQVVGPGRRRRNDESEDDIDESEDDIDELEDD